MYINELFIEGANIQLILITKTEKEIEKGKVNRGKNNRIVLISLF